MKGPVLTKKTQDRHRHAGIFRRERKDALNTMNYRIRMGLLGIWAAIVTVLVFFVSLVTWGHTVSGWLYARMLSGLGMPILGLSLRVSGRENLGQEPAVILINHQSNLDAIVLGTTFPWKTVIIAKREMLKVPLFGIILLASKNILIDREDNAGVKKTIQEVVKAVQKDKNNIWIFPEGTRSLGKGLGPFKKGAFIMAIAAQAPIIPIVNQPLEHVVDSQNKILRKGLQQVKIFPAISTRGLKFRDADRLMQEMEEFFHQELAKFSA